MIPEQAIVEWRRKAPWDANSLVEQDLVISRALVEMYSVPEIAQRLALRGGTALYKLHLRPAARYSEDIDVVQIQPEAIGKRSQAGEREASRQATRGEGTVYESAEDFVDSLD